MLIISSAIKAVSAGANLQQSAQAKTDLRKAEKKAKKYVKKAYESASVNAQRMRTIDPSIYDTASENLSQDLSTVLDITAGEDPRLTAAMGSKLFQQSQKQRQALEMQKRKDIQALEKDIAEGEQARLGRIANLDIAQATGFQQQAADAQQRRVAAQQQALQAPASIVGDYTSMIEAGVSPMQIEKGFEGMFAGSQPSPSNQLPLDSFSGTVPFTPPLGAQSQFLNNTQQPDVNVFDLSLDPRLGMSTMQPVTLGSGSQFLDPNYQQPMNMYGVSLSGQQYLMPGMQGLKLD